MAGPYLYHFFVRSNGSLAFSGLNASLAEVCGSRVCPRNLSLPVPWPGGRLLRSWLLAGFTPRVPGFSGDSLNQTTFVSSRPGHADNLIVRSLAFHSIELVVNLSYLWHGYFLFCPATIWSRNYSQHPIPVRVCISPFIYLGRR